FPRLSWPRVSSMETAASAQETSGMRPRKDKKSQAETESIRAEKTARENFPAKPIAKEAEIKKAGRPRLRRSCFSFRLNLFQKTLFLQLLAVQTIFGPGNGFQ